MLNAVVFMFEPTLKVLNGSHQPAGVFVDLGMSLNNQLSQLYKVI